MQDSSTHVDAASIQRDTSHNVAKELMALHAKDRLGVHMFEHRQGLDFPEFSQQGIAALDGKNIRDSLHDYAQRQTPMISFSLAQPLTRLFTPFHMTHDLESRQGYLLDLSQEGDNPVHILRVGEGDLASGFDFYKKNLKIPPNPHQTRYEEIDSIYIGHTPESFVQAVADNAASLGDKQLDALAGIYRHSKRGKPPVSSHNEVIGAMSNTHIKAIATFISAVRYEDNFNYEQCKSRLASALCALDHLNHGIDMPAVVFNLDPEPIIKEKELQGFEPHIEYVGQGREQLESVVREQLVEMKAHYVPKLQNEMLGWAEMMRYAATIMQVPEKRLYRQIEKQAESLDSGRC